MFILKILFILLCILFLLLLLILLVPFGYRIKAVSLDEKRVGFSAGWFFGLLGFSGDYVFNQGFVSRVHVLGMIIKVNKKDREEEKETKKEKNKKKKRVFSVKTIKYILISIKNVLKHLMPDRIVGYGRLGFYDPYYTAMACSLIESLRSFRFHHLSLNYIFDDEVYEGEIDIQGRIFLVYIVYIAIRLFLNKSARKLILN